MAGDLFAAGAPRWAGLSSVSHSEPGSENTVAYLPSVLPNYFRWICVLFGVRAHMIDPALSEKRASLRLIKH
jgi:hypothetical protein